MNTKFDGHDLQLAASLIGAMLDDSLDDAGVAQLERLSIDNPLVAKEYLLQLHFDTMVRSWYLSKSAAPLLDLQS